jgi:hypothetical protein
MGRAAKDWPAIGWVGTGQARMGRVGTGEAKIGRLGTGQSGTGQSRKKLQRTLLLLTGLLTVNYKITIEHILGEFHDQGDNVKNTISNRNHRPPNTPYRPAGGWPPEGRIVMTP